MIAIERPQKKPTPMLSPHEVAEALNVDYFTVIYWLQKGTLKGTKLGKLWRVYPEDLQAFLDRGSNQGGNVENARRTQASE